MFSMFRFFSHSHGSRCLKMEWLGSSLTPLDADGYGYGARRPSSSSFLDVINGSLLILFEPQNEPVLDGFVLLFFLYEKHVWLSLINEDKTRQNLRRPWQKEAIYQVSNQLNQQ